MAGLVGKSEDWLKLIEAGKRGLPLPAAVKLARLLGVTDLSEIYGTDLSAPLKVVDRPTHPQAAAVSHALSAYLIQDAEPTPVADYVAAVDAAWRNWQLSPTQRSDAGAVLPTLILTGRAAVAAYQGSDRRTAQVALAAVYHLAQAFFAWQQDASQWVWLSAVRGLETGEAADDLVARATGVFYYAHVLRSAGRADEALDMLRLVVDELEPLLADGDDEVRALWGVLQMCRASTAARYNHDASAWTYWEQADRVVSSLPKNYAHPWHLFGRSFVDLHKTVLSVCLGDNGEAIRHSDSFQVEKVPSRLWAASHLVNVARAYHQKRDNAALLPLLQAERYSPEAVRFNVSAREIVSDIAAAGRGPLRAEAVEVAHRLQIAV
ncbi:hypothetical protein LX83_007264 [Goodfellowiella coeruleoviolacea]|uniref:XRE family transcriptional regulator n=1 Tax=Goodfellowiella coeruleoviolacea TaxID=334858 RepID=A0AAE3GMP9_9PSEU|nr:hypothetical protein [Goodfellowiella coeruleoviolacea]